MVHGYFNVTVVEEWITFFAALLFLNRKTGAWQLFRLLMSFILIAETVGWYLRVNGYRQYNAMPFNVLMLLTDSFLIWFFGVTKWFEGERKILLIAVVLFLAFWL